MFLLIYLQIIVLIYFLSHRTQGVDHGGFTSSENGVKEGEKHYGRLVGWSKDPTYGWCWQQVIVQLDVGCEALTDVLQSRLAFRLVNCFLETSGLEPYQDCSGDLRDCIPRMKDRDIATYATFFAHTHNMCSFLKGQVWRQKTESTINRLAEASSRAGAMLERASVYQEQTLATQERFLRSQEAFQRSLQQVNDGMEASKASVLELFKQLLTLRTALFDGLANFYTVMYYTFSLSIGYLLTTTKRTERARLWLFLIFTIAITAESYLAKLVNDHFNDPPNQYRLIWMIRSAVLALSFVTLGISAWCYVDWTQASYTLLQANTIKLCTIEQCLQTITPNSSPGGSGNLSINRYNSSQTFPNGTSFSKTGSEEIIPKQRQPESVARQRQTPFDHGPLSSTPDQSPSHDSGSPRYNLRNRSLLRSSPLTDVQTIQSSRTIVEAVERSERQPKRKSIKLRRKLVMERNLNEVAAFLDESGSSA